MSPIVDRILGEISTATPDELEAYVCGACHDGTTGRAGTTRIGQKSLAWIEFLHDCIERLGQRAWIYREGREREFWIVETSGGFHQRRCVVPDGLAARAAYVRGYFDAEGGIPRSPSARFYVQIGQKDHACLAGLREAMSSLGVSCGALHRPSAAVDPDYWRFAVRAGGFRQFNRIIGSWHPVKRPILDARFSHS